MTIIRRKLYKRGSSVETTIPKPMLFALDMNKKHNILFHYDHVADRWYIEFEEVKEETEKKSREKNRSKRTGSKKQKRSAKRTGQNQKEHNKKTEHKEKQLKKAEKPEDEKT